MDAAQTQFKKVVFSLATALLLMAPLQASAQALSASPTSVQIGSSSCNNFQNVLVTSTTNTNIPFTVAVQYSGSTPNTGDAYGNWLYAKVSNGGLTSTGTPFTTNTGTTGVTVIVGLNLAIGAITDTATVVLTDTTNASDTQTITVTYTQNTSCGGNTGSTTNGVISATPGNISVTAGLGGSGSQTVTVQNLTSSTQTFSLSVLPTSSWLSATASSFTLAGNASATVTVTGNSSSLSATGTYNGTLTISGAGTALNIPVTFVVTTGSGGGGGGNTGTLTVGGTGTNTSTSIFNYIAPNLPGANCVPLQDTAAGANSYFYQTSTTTGGSWLLANNNISGTVAGLLAPSSNACVNLSLAANVAGSLASGVYQGSVALTSSSGATATINVVLAVSAGVAPGVSVNPGVIYQFPNVAVSSDIVQSQSFTITAAAGYTMGLASLGSSANGFSMSTPVASGNTQTFAVTANSTGLAAGYYSTTVTLQSTNTSTSVNSNTTITILLPVGEGSSSGGGTTPTLVAPTSLSFQLQQGNPAGTGGQEAQTITITGQSGTAWSAGIVYGSGSNWLGIVSPAGASGTFGSGPVSLVVDLVGGASNLTPSSTPYAATVAITTANGTSNVAVSVLVTAANIPVLLGLPATTTFTANNGVAPASQSAFIVGSDNPTSTTQPPIVLGTPTVTWLTATATGNTLTMSVNPSGQATGVYSGTIPVSASAYSNPINYPVVMIVNSGSSQTGPLTLSTTSMSFTNVTGTLNQILNITASSSTNFTAAASETTCLGNSWLSVPTGSYTASSSPVGLTVTVNPNGIANGTTCAGVISLISSVTQTVTVTMTVGAAGGSGNVTVNPTAMSFSYTQGQANPAAQTATIVNATTGTASIAFTVTTANTGQINWLQTSVTSAATPYNNPGLSVSVAPGSLAPGTYQGTVTITPTGGTAVVINVTLTVSGNEVVTATPTTLSLSYQVGGTSPTGTIAVSGGGSAAPFTATASSTSNWLVVTPTSGTTPNSGTFNLTASIAPSALSSLLPSGSPYTGSITVTGTSPASGTTIVNVTLVVTAPLPVISGVTNGASFATGAVSPGELISIFANAANPIGPATPVALNSTTCPSPCTQVPFTMGGVTVTFLPLGLPAPLLYVSAGQVNAVVPYEVKGVANVSVEVKFLGQTSNAFPLSTAATAPGIFTATGIGTGQASVGQYDATGKYQGTNSVSNPALPGWILAVYMTGEGVLTPPATDGSVTVPLPNPPFLPVPLNVPNATIGNQPCSLAGYGEAVGIVSGVLQVNVIVPANVGPGQPTLVVSLGTASSQASVTVAIQ